MSVRNQIYTSLRLAYHSNTTAVEVAPVYDNAGETTVLAAAEVVHSLLSLMVSKLVQA